MSEVRRKTGAEVRVHGSIPYRELDSLGLELRKRGFVVDEGKCPFFLVKVGNASVFRKKMLREYRIAVRDCTSFGMPDNIRIMPSTPDRNDALLEASARMHD